MYQFLPTPFTENKTITHTKPFPKIIPTHIKLTPIKTKKQYKTQKGTFFYHKQYKYRIFKGPQRVKSQEITPYCSCTSTEKDPKLVNPKRHTPLAPEPTK